MLTSNSKQINTRNNNNKKSKLYTFQIETSLIPGFYDKVEDQFGRYKKSKVLNVLIKGYVDGKYTVDKLDKTKTAVEPDYYNDYYDMEC